MDKRLQLANAYRTLRLPQGTSVRQVKKRFKAIVALIAIDGAGPGLTRDDDLIAQQYDILLHHFRSRDHDRSSRCACQPDSRSYSATPPSSIARLEESRQRHTIEASIYQLEERQSEKWRWKVAITCGVAFTLITLLGWGKRNLTRPEQQWVKPRTLEEIRHTTPSIKRAAQSPPAIVEEVPVREPIVLPPHLQTAEMAALDSSIRAKKAQIAEIGGQIQYLERQKNFATQETAGPLHDEIVRLSAQQMRLSGLWQAQEGQLYQLMQEALAGSQQESNVEEARQEDAPGENDDE
ncbi:MAG: hypothetical protein K8F91_03015 [Candidatus Obscuribacterales bacterium]|nr:hypothetical protein [Candidatus Obscuribacterales bacterium]